MPETSEVDLPKKLKINLIGAIPLCYINIEVFIPSKTQEIFCVLDGINTSKLRINSA